MIVPLLTLALLSPGGILQGGIAQAGRVQGEVAPEFAKVVLRDFDEWDLDHNGALAPEEVERSVLDPRFRGEDAAALAALHGWLSGTTESVPRLTKEWFLSYRPVRFRVEKGTPPGEAKALRKAYQKTPGSLQSAFVASLRRVSRANTEILFNENGPALSDIRQGALGDCYMLAPLGAIVHREAGDVKGMIRAEDGGYTVRFGDGKSIRVAGLTETELALGGANSQEGLWIRVVEKAYGSRKFADGESAQVARDGMSGGSPGVAGRAFTGHPFTSIRLGGNKAPVADEALLKRLREELPKALAAKRIVCASTPKEGMPKSIDGNHAYAVFAFDPVTDRITLWNPHGNDFRPKGEEGETNGFRREGGVFTIPLTLFARVFGRVYIESAS